jgi:hypothetical protein
MVQLSPKTRIEKNSGGQQAVATRNKVATVTTETRVTATLLHSNSAGSKAKTIISMGLAMKLVGSGRDKKLSKLSLLLVKRVQTMALAADAQSHRAGVNQKTATIRTYA